MAEKKQGKRAGNGAWNSEVSFVNYSWTVQDDADYEAWLKKEAPDAWEAADLLIYEGYRISMGWDDSSRTNRVTLICNSPKHPHDGHGFSSWAESTEDALLTCFYKVKVLFAGIRPEVVQRANTVRR